jgi:hypothetical protein
MPRLSGKRELVTGWLYDTGRLNAGTLVTEMSLFITPRGDAGFGLPGLKDFQHTNMEGAGGFLTGVKAFVIKSYSLRVHNCGPGISLIIDNDDPPPPFFLVPFLNNSDTICAVLMNGYGTVRIGDLGKPYPTEWPLWMLAGGTQLFDSVRGVTAPLPFPIPNIHGTFGPGNIGNVMAMTCQLPIPINTLEVFEVTLNWPAGIDVGVASNGFIPSLDLTFVMYGFLKRQVA